MRRLVHLADLHLGGVRLDKLSRDDGRNQRSVDVGETFTRVVDQVIAIAPDFVLIAGDVFDKPQPKNHALITAMNALQKLRAACPVTRIVMISGNHDMPSGAGGRDFCVLPLFRGIGCQVIDQAPTRLRFGDVAILCVPEHVAHLTKLEPDTTAARNVLLLHGEIGGVIPGARESKVTIAPERLTSHGWDYIALGHYHVTQEVAPRCWYAGAIDYTSTNVWGEMDEEQKRGLEGKGFLEVDLETGTVVRHAITGTRRWIDLPPIDGRDLSAAELDALVEANVAGVDITDAVVRQVVINVPVDRNADMRTTRRKDWIQASLSIDIDVRRPPLEGKRIVGVNDPVKVRKNLDELIHERIAGLTIPEEQEGDRDRLHELANLYQDVAAKKLEESVRATEPRSDTAGTPRLRKTA